MLKTFAYHKPNATGVQHIETTRKLFSEIAERLAVLCDNDQVYMPIIMQHLETACMFATKAIAMQTGETKSEDQVESKCKPPAHSAESWSAALAWNHAQAVLNLQQQLFSKHKPKDCNVVDSSTGRLVGFGIGLPQGVKESDKPPVTSETKQSDNLDPPADLLLKQFGIDFTKEIEAMKEELTAAEARQAESADKPPEPEASNDSIDWGEVYKRKAKGSESRQLNADEVCAWLENTELTAESILEICGRALKQRKQKLGF